MKRLSCLIVILVWIVNGAAAQRPPRRRAAAKPVVATRSGQQKFKAIWEPINYPDDLILMSVHFANDQQGWISGGSSWDKGGFILATKDGGDHWVVQMGDPQSSDPSINELRFIDATHAWGVQGKKLVRTSDGANWEDAGSLPQFSSFLDYAFTTATDGVYVGGFNGSASTIFATHDGGQTWKKVFECATKVVIDGLTKNTGCQLFAFNFPSPSVGFAVGGSYNDGPGQGFFVVAKTEDGGNTWKLVSSVSNIPHAEGVFFTSASSGVTRNHDRKFYLTSDGGTTWTGATGSNDGRTFPIMFANPQVGWTAGERSMAYTTDGGKHWYSRDLSLPATNRALSLASPERAYVVGEHGMIYRYRVVPADYTAKGMVAAPMIPGASAEAASSK